MRRVLRSRTTFVLLLVLVGAMTVLFGVERWVATPLGISTPSMEPALEPGDRILVQRSHDSEEQLRETIERGDVVVFHAPEDGAPLLIKRVIALPGEEIQARDGVIAIDDERLLDEEWLPDSERRVGTDGADSVDIERTRLAEDEVFVLGDNRDASIDSRSFGPVQLDRIVGRSAVRIWPPGRFGTLDWS